LSDSASASAPASPSTPAGSGPSTGRLQLLDKRLLRESPRARIALGVAVGLGLLSTACILVQALALADLLSSAMPGGPVGLRSRALLALAVAAALRGLASLGAEITAQWGASSVKAELRRRLLGGALRGAPGTAGACADSPGELAVLAGRGLDALDVYVGRCLPDYVVAVAAPIVLVVAIGALDWLSGLIVVAVLTLFPLFGALVGRTSTSLAKSRWSQLEQLGLQIEDVFRGLVVLKAFGRSSEQRKRIEAASEALRATSMGTLRVAFLSALVLDTLASVSVALVAVPLGLRLLHGSVPLSAALAVLIVAPEVFLPLRRAGAEFHESTEGLAALSKIWDVVPPRAPASVANPSSNRGGHVDPALSPVTLSNVRVEFPGRENPVLRDANLRIGDGEIVALVGANGAGKSTVVSLLLGLEQPSSGSVRVGGRSLEEFGVAEWRRHVSYLAEHPCLIAGSLADNVRLGNPAASDAEILKVLDAVEARALLERLPAGLSARLGDGGHAVSAGELQKVALARVLLRPARLYLLDEPTVHLDPEAESAVVAALGRLLDGRSALIVTHRPAVLVLADRVVELCGGRLVKSEAGLGAENPVPVRETGDGAFPDGALAPVLA